MIPRKVLRDRKLCLVISAEYIAKPVYERGSSIQTLSAMSCKLLMNRRVSGNGYNTEKCIEYREKDILYYA